FTERDGLIDDTIRALAIDDDIVWLATAHGLTRFDTRRGAFVSFDASEGLPTSGFNGGASCTGSGQLYFGSSHGLLTIPRGLPVASAPAAPTVLRAVRTLEGMASADRAPWDLERLEVAYGEILSFAFAVLDYGDPRRHRFAYRLTGLRDEWIEIDERREVTFTDLDPGEYTLEVRGRSSHGVWSDAATSLSLVVVPPFWMTTWFRVAVLTSLVLAVLAAHRRRTSTLERRNRELMALKNQREAALAEMHASQEQLHETYDRLRRLTRRLELAKEDERKRIARELHDEMGQGLTAAKINLQLLAALPGSAETKDRASDTIELVDRMIQHVRALSLDLRPPLLDELGLSPALRSYLEAQAQRTGIDIEIADNGLPGDLPAEVGITAFRFVQEAVTNVIRHAEASRVDVDVMHAQGRLELTVRDDGSGFDVGQALHRASSGQHLGLLGIRERVESLGGQLEIDSSPGKGTSLAVNIPWR
ncbi:MAG: ATP-binding protein, partial [Acidobacteriota bacterium]